MLSQSIKKLAATKGKNAKIEVLAAELAKNDDLYKLMVCVYSPFITYGIANTKKLLAEYSGKGTNAIGEKDFEVLHALANRELSGKAAKEAVAQRLESLCPDEAELFLNILKKDLRITMGVSSVNEAIANIEGLEQIETYDCQLAQDFDPARMLPGVSYSADFKLDGMRCQAWVSRSNGTVRYLSRNGLPITSPNDQLIEETKRFVNSIKIEEGTEVREDIIILDTELEKFGDSFNETISATKKKAQQEELKLAVFDILTIDEFEGRGDVGFMKRRARYLATSVTPLVQMTELYPVKDEHDVRALYEAARAQKKEGVIVKADNYIYEPVRTFAWMKVKDEKSEDLPIVGIKPGEGKYEGMIGAYTVRRANGVLVDVGSGLSDADRLQDPETLIGKILEVEYHEETPEGSLRHPRAKCLRWDKE